MQQKKKLLFTGGSGLLALNWAMQLAHDFDVTIGLHTKKITVPGLNAVQVSMETVALFSADLKKIQPDIVIHCAGLANVEACEADPQAAYQINVVLSENVAQACKEQGIQFVYISTDHLFSGLHPLVTEEDETFPLNEYGRTKLEGEKKILAVSEKFFCIRTNFYGWGPSYRHSFSDFIIKQLRSGQAISLFDDFYYTPVLIEELAQTVMELLNKSASGIFNVVGNERISKYAFGMRLAERFDLDTSLIRVARFADRKDLVKRPLDISLSNKKISDLLNREVGNISHNIDRLYAQEQDGFSEMIQSI
jgi:dTDP-4-dehydrorhamnose reductase